MALLAKVFKSWVGIGVASVKHTASKGVVAKRQKSRALKPGTVRRKIDKTATDFRSTDWYEKAARSFAIPVDRRNSH